MVTYPNRELITSVRPTKDGKWEVLVVTPLQERQWRLQWDKWFAEFGEALWLEHPEWWPEK